MKKILLILAVALLAGCKTENIYLTILPVTRVTEITDTIYCLPDNRFRRDFRRADSVFERASDEAMKSSKEKVKHLLKQRVKYETK